MLPFRLSLVEVEKMDSLNPDTSELADALFHPSNYEDDKDLSEALATTHEQVSDVYMAGTSDGITFLENGAVRENSMNRRQASDRTKP